MDLSDDGLSMRSAAAPERGAARLGDYCLISPARNEAQFIRKTLDSVLAQTVLMRQ